MHASSARKAKDGAFKYVHCTYRARIKRGRYTYNIYKHTYTHICIYVRLRDHQLTRETRRSRKRVRGLVQMSSWDGKRKRERERWKEICIKREFIYFARAKLVRSCKIRRRKECYPWLRKNCIPFILILDKCFQSLNDMLLYIYNFRIIKSYTKNNH